jgi:8-oxo-dGTP diphosphatase
MLIKKKRGLGAGFYNGVGGKVEKVEDAINCVIREAMEEVGVKVKEVEWVGLLEFINRDENNKVLDWIFTHVFIAKEYEGNFMETEEAKPMWFDTKRIPYDNMWEDDKYWLPLVLKGEKVYCRFEFLNWKLIKSEVYKLRK